MISPVTFDLQHKRRSDFIIQSEFDHWSLIEICNSTQMDNGSPNTHFAGSSYLGFSLGLEV